jgi:hypothetical protein
MPHRPAQPPRHVERVERQDAATPWIDPEQLLFVGRFRHREHPAGIGSKQKLWGQPKQTLSPVTTKT